MTDYGEEMSEQRKQRQKKQMRAYYLANQEYFQAYQHDYRIHNAAHVKERNKAYYLANHEKILSYNTEYQAAHPEMKLLAARTHYWSHKEQINEWQCTKVKCGCGGKYTFANKAQHFKSQKHGRYIAA